MTIRKLINTLKPLVFTRAIGSHIKNNNASSEGIECSRDGDTEALEINPHALQCVALNEELVLGSNNVIDDKLLIDDFRVDQKFDRLAKLLEDDTEYGFSESLADFDEQQLQGCKQYSENQKEYKPFEQKPVLIGRNDLPNDFGYRPYKYPDSVRDFRPTPIKHDLRPYGEKLTGESYDDLISVLKRIKEISDPASIDAGIVKDSVKTFLEYLCGQRGVNYTAGTVCIEQLSISKIERDLLREENKKLHGALSDANRMNSSLTNVINGFRIGSLAGRTTHQLCLFASNECYMMLTSLIKSSPLYDIEIEIPGIGKTTIATIRSKFGSLGGLALATREVILSLDGVGLVTLKKIISYFLDNNMPAVCVLSWKLGERLNWAAVSRISSIDDYQWKLPSFMFPYEAALTRKVGGTSSLEVINLEENHHGGSLDSGA